MSDGRKFYCFCDSNCKYETMTKEQILAAIAQAMETGSVGDCDTGFITKVKEQNKGDCVTFWVGTQAQYNALENKAANCLYIVTDNTKGDDIMRACEHAVDTAEQAHAEVLALKSNANAIDVKSEVTLANVVSSGGQNLTTLSLTIKEFRYYPALGMVFCVVAFDFAGKLAKGEKIHFMHYGEYKPATSFPYYPMPIGSSWAGVPLSAYYCGDGLHIVANEAIETADVRGVFFSGWFTCNPS